MSRILSNVISGREGCGFSDVGKVLAKDPDGVGRLVLTDRNSKEHPVPIDLPMTTLFPPNRTLDRIVTSRKNNLTFFDASKTLFQTYPQYPEQDLIRIAIERVFTLPAVGSKSFLITIGDRSVGGLTVRDQMVGPWQTPVADVGVSATSLNMDKLKTGEAIAMGDKPSLAFISPGASTRMAAAESLMNLGAAHLLGAELKKGVLSRVTFSANWMAAVK
jgi:phosphoribosylformylglycinamidine synthase